MNRTNCEFFSFDGIRLMLPTKQAALISLALVLFKQAMKLLLVLLFIQSQPQLGFHMK